jgi:hypothetical protein
MHRQLLLAVEISYQTLIVFNLDFILKFLTTTASLGSDPDSIVCFHAYTDLKQHYCIRITISVWLRYRHCPRRHQRQFVKVT